MFRLPLPYRVGDAFRPGNGDEKVRCEAGTYAWLEENCPDVPIPRFYGFGVSTGETFTRIENLSVFVRWYQYLRHWILSLLGYSLPSFYVRRRRPPKRKSKGHNPFRTAYMLIEYIEETRGRMLSETWLKGQQATDPVLRANLFRSISQILLSISRIPLPRIGSFVIDNGGYLRLTNRPLTIELQELENEEIPTDISRDYTYSTVDSYAMDMLGIHNNRIRYQPNAINHVADGAYQIGVLTGMRTVMPTLFKRELRRGPFVFTFTDMHRSNIFVDDKWHITCLVDLEWACSRPIEMLQPPEWLTDKAVDILAKESDEYNKLRVEFMRILAAEEEACGKRQCRWDVLGDGTKLSTLMENGWELGTFWYCLALASPTSVFAIFDKQIRHRYRVHEPRQQQQQPMEGDDEEEDLFDRVMPWYWSQDSRYVLKQKLSDKRDYDRRLKEAFGIEPDKLAITWER
ncbi:hypothetical protein MAP00_005321 [Monascus purpureus]|nr:hypothetical protein MAP00_005321 [Monascus purpureus]